MKISIFGLGYVGTVLTGCFARNGHQIIGVDTDAVKVDLINQGKSPVIEPELEPMIAQGVQDGRIRATTDHQSAVLQTELSRMALRQGRDFCGNCCGAGVPSSSGAGG